MLTFENDYSQGAHPTILERLVETNMLPESGYGYDSYTASAIEKIREVISCPKADVYFLVGGTQTNQVVIDTVLESYEGVIAADSGHITVHEAGAIEYSGHKVLALPGQKGGKLDAKSVRDYVTTFYSDGNHSHMVYPGMVYISYPTEYGYLYSKEELLSLREVCDEFEMSLFIDGARMGYGVMSEEADVTMADIASIADIFYIGGTKIGALCGEAVVFTKNNTPKHFMTMVKQHGALLAKSRLMGIQFSTLFTDDLYFKISAHALKMAHLLKKGLLNRGWTLYVDSPTNQQFFIVDNDTYAILQSFVKVSFWEKYDDNHTVVRFATSWATTTEQVDTLLTLIDQHFDNT